MNSLRFQIDEHLPHAVAHALRRRGIDVLTASEAGLLGTSDAEMLALSFAEGRVVVTYDDDVLRLNAERQPHAGIVFSAQHARSIRELIAALLLIYEVMEPHEIAGRVEYL